MKGIYLIAIAFLAPCIVTATQNGTIGTLDLHATCPSVDPCPPLLFPHESNCGLYYECKGGRPQMRRCASGLYFSERWQGCVKPSVSECNTGEDGSCRNGELMEHECQCTKYYECKNGWKVLRDCPTGWHFNKMRQMCVEGDCGSNGGDCINGERTAHECQCEKYYVCKNGQRALRDCPPGNWFNPDVLDCVPGSCDPPVGICIEGEQKSHDCHCDKFYKCKNQEWVLQQCQNGDHFSPSRLTCLPPRQAGCDGEPEPVPGECPIPTPTGPWPHECDCRLYYTCRNGQKEIQSCSWGNYFNRATTECSPADTVSCRNNWETH
ncbi:Peritrophin-48 [Ooceraea biroi]|uniref:Peritrophin-48 n=1 Tax=Ooceraea biroi TaxID=2015173 RepID=A0A026WU34_OOCBI|nr:Peritrophin-48 [Ooceraea biroi]